MKKFPRRAPLLALAAMLSSGLALYSQTTQSEGQSQGQTDSLISAGPVHQTVRVSSRVIAGMLVKKVNPIYPKEARKKHVQGVVMLHAIIDKQGAITRLEVVSGDPLLASSALDAARQWKYRPYVLQGQPVEVETEIQVNFTLAP